MRFNSTKSLLLSVFILVGGSVVKADGACHPDLSNLEKMFSVCFEEAGQGHAAAQFNLAIMYYRGEGAVQDYQAAIYWFTKAAEQGNAYAQYNLGLMYKTGEGTTQDYKAALHWYTKAAEQGDANAQCNLAIMYYYGDGTVQDFIEAYAWASVAAAQGNELGVKARDQILEAMTLSQVEKGQAQAKGYFDKYSK